MDQSKVINLSNKQAIKKGNHEIPEYKLVGFTYGGHQEKDRKDMSDFNRTSGSVWDFGNDEVIGAR
jgi:hypothetical protein